MDIYGSNVCLYFTYIKDMEKHLLYGLARDIILVTEIHKMQRCQKKHIKGIEKHIYELES